MKTIKIYTLQDPITLEYKYIGKTINKLEYRLSAHISETKKGRSCYRHCWIKSLLNKGLHPLIELLDETEDVNWNWLEIYWISQFKTWGFNLVNLSDGGENDFSFRKQ